MVIFYMDLLLLYEFITDFKHIRAIVRLISPKIKIMILKIFCYCLLNITRCVNY